MEHEDCPHCGRKMNVIPRGERKKRRKLIADDAAKDQRDLYVLAEKYNVHLSTVYSSMREFGVPRIRHKETGFSQFEILANILNREDGTTDTQIASQLGLTNARISQVHSEARAWGLAPSKHE